MALTLTRVHAPVKGWNTTTPIREMDAQYAARLENVWFDRSGGMNRRPAQTTFGTSGVAVGGLIKSLHEHYSITGTSALFASASDTNFYKSTGAAWTAVAALNGVFTSKVRSGTLGNVLICGDGINVRSYNGTVWATPTGVNPMNSFTSYNGRMYGCGDAAQKTLVYYSTPDSGTGATDWGIGAGGGFINVGGALDEGDAVVAVTSYQGLLVALCKNSVIFYSGTDPNNPTTFRVQKTIKGIGCASADSVQGVGNDTIFLSSYGFKTLKEIAVQGDAAAFDASVPINNHVITQLPLIDVTAISSTFAESLGVYMCTFGNETLVYHTLFKSWVSWNGIQDALLTVQNGVTYTATTMLHKLNDTAVADTIDNGTPVAIPMVWETAPFRASSKEQRSRWNKVELLYEGVFGDTVVVKTWTNLDERQASYDEITLEPSVPTIDNNSLLYIGSATASVRNAWGTATTGASWGGGVGGFLSGDEALPVIGRGELFSIRISNNNMTKFKVIALEAYYNTGGLRK